jgi:hypothetical protein
MENYKNNKMTFSALGLQEMDDFVDSDNNNSEKDHFRLKITPCDKFYFFCVEL